MFKTSKMKSVVVVCVLLMIMFAVVECVIELCSDKNVGKEETIFCNKYFQIKHPLLTVPIVRYKLTSIEMTEQEIKELPYNAFHNYSIHYNISIISLTLCNIERVDADAFLNLHHLKRLDLTQNMIRHLDGKLFQHVTQIQEIRINRNMIKKLPAELFHNLFSLEKVEMHANEIELIEPGTFNNVPLLSHIDLGSNKLQYLDQSVVQSLSNVSYFYLHDNPWICDCNLLQLRDLFSKVPLTSAGQLPECENPVKLRGRKWKDLSSDEFQCVLQILEPRNNSEVVIADTNVTLTCQADASSKPDMKWYKNSAMIQPQYLSQSSSNDMYYLYYTFSVDEYSAGVYNCIATNSKRRQESSITLGVYRKTKKPIGIGFSLVGTINISGSLGLASKENPIHVMLGPQVTEEKENVTTMVNVTYQEHTAKQNMET